MPSDIALVITSADTRLDRAAAQRRDGHGAIMRFSSPRTCVRIANRRLESVLPPSAKPKAIEARRSVQSGMANGKLCEL